jgi:hypothetical protein
VGLQKKLNILGAIIFLAPIAIPAFVHSEPEARKWIYLAYVFCWPLAGVILSLGKKRPPVFFWGMLFLLLPMELFFYFSYQAAIVHPTKHQIAAFYIPIFFFTAMVGLPLGMALTYKGTRDA